VEDTLLGSSGITAGPHQAHFNQNVPREACATRPASPAWRTISLERNRFSGTRTGIPGPHDAAEHRLLGITRGLSQHRSNMTTWTSKAFVYCEQTSFPSFLLSHGAKSQLLVLLVGALIPMGDLPHGSLILGNSPHPVTVTCLPFSLFPI
jgi:hypothetical protein